MATKASYNETLYYLRKRAILQHGTGDCMFSHSYPQKIFSNIKKAREKRRAKVKTFFCTVMEYISKIQSARV